MDERETRQRSHGGSSRKLVGFMARPVCIPNPGVVSNAATQQELQRSIS